MTILDSLKDAATVLRTADKIPQYTAVLEGLRKIAELEESVRQFTEQNCALQERLRIRNARQDARFGYAYLEDNVPLCQKCLYGDEKRVPLDPLKKFASGREERQCPVCNKTYVEKEGEQTAGVPRCSSWLSEAASFYAR